MHCYENTLMHCYENTLMHCYENTLMHSHKLDIVMRLVEIGILQDVQTP